MSYALHLNKHFKCHFLASLILPLLTSSGSNQIRLQSNYSCNSKLLLNESLAITGLHITAHLQSIQLNRQTMSGSYRINFIVDIAISHKRVVFFDFHKLLDYSELIFDEMIKLCWTDKTCISGFLNIHKTAIGLRIPCLAVSMLIKSHYLWRK